ncbi:MAG: hypothetical protein ACRDTT_24075, partial [Pseudonocardiaceae bacterium]
MATRSGGSGLPWKRLGSGTRGRLVDYAFMAVFVLLVVIAAVSSDFFFSQTNLTNIARQIVTNGLISLGMLVV